jgi:Zn-dependent metalloprotease
MKSRPERDAARDRIATDPCSLSPGQLACALKLVRQSDVPVALTGDDHRSWQIHGRFRNTKTAEERLAFARELLACLGRDKIPGTLRPCKGQDTCFALEYDGVPVYRGGVVFGQADGGAVDTVTLAVPAAAPSKSLRWGDPRQAEATVRAHWDLDDVGATWQFGAPERVWYIPSLVYGTDDGESWLPAWLFSQTDAEQAYDVIVSGDGKSILDIPITGGEATLAPLPRYHLRAETGVPDFITWGQTGLLLPEAATGSPERVGRALFDRYPKLFGTGDSIRQLQVIRTDSSIGWPRTRHVIFQQLYGGFPVFGCELRTHLSPSLAVLSVSGDYLRDPQVSLDAPVSETRALDAVSVASARGDDREIEPPNELRANGLVIFPSVLSPGGGPINHLAWWIQSSRWEWFVSAQTGSVIGRLSARLNARLTYDANQKTSGERLEVKDGMDLTAGMSDPDSIPVDMSMAGVESFWGLFGWMGWNGRGADDISIVDAPVPNAEWRPWDKQVRYNRNFTTPSTVGHEFTHGVIQQTSGLKYIGEPGALNESFADVFGKLMFPGTPPDWLLKLNDGTVTSDLRNPGIGSYSQYTKFPLDNFGVHFNSGIGSRAAVLACDGDGSPAHLGIGRELLSRLWWDTMTLRLHPWATYLDFCHAVRETVRDLARLGTSGVQVPASPSAGGSAPTFTAATIPEVDWALSQVELNPSLLSGWFTIPGTFNQTITLNQGALVPSDQIVSDADFVVSRQRDADKTQFLFGRARVSLGGGFLDQSGTIQVSILTSGVGTRSKEITAKVKNTGGVPFESEGIVYTTQVSPPVPPPTTTTWVSPGIAHWFDNPFFLGRRYGDIVYETVGLPAVCSVLDVRLELLQMMNGVLVVRGQTRLGQPPAVWGGTGAVIPMPPTIPGSLEVRVRSWHDFGWIVRYRLVYEISGTCVPTAFAFREVNPFTFT